jgi:ELWxxDGT repeat protein
MKIKLVFLIIVIAFLNHSDVFSQSKVERIETNIYAQNDFITFKNRLFFIGLESGQTWRPYISDGTKTGTKLLKNITIPDNSNKIVGYTNWTISGDKMFFIASDSINGYELWLTDGTENGTRLVKNISPKDTSTSIVKIRSLSNGKVYFYLSPHNQPLKVQLWVSDGTEAGTYSFFEAPTISISIDVFNNQMYYYINEGLWLTDGTANGTKLIKNLREPNTELGGLFTPFAATSQKFFFSTFASNGYRLWVSDGTPQGTFLPDTSLVSASYLTPLGNKVFFRGVTRNNNKEGLWISDGTPTGTKLLKYITSMRNVTILNNKILFAALDSLSNNWALWTSDGTEMGTFMVKNDFSISENFSFSLNETIPHSLPFYTLKNKAYFFANRSRLSFPTGELYESDGTARGTDTLRSFPEHKILRYDQSNAAVLGDKLYLGIKEEISVGVNISEYRVGLHVISNPTSKIENTEGVTDIKIYPTLTNDWLFVESPTYKINKIRIFDLLGHIVLNQNNYSYQASIYLNNLIKNAYFIQIETENGIITKKFFKM